MDYKIIDNIMSEVILKDLSLFDQKKIEEYAKLDKKNGIYLSVMIDNLTINGNEKYNYQNFIEGRNFFHTQYGFLPYPPFTYLSNDIHFIKSTLTLYGDKNYDTYYKLKEMNLEQYLIYLEQLYQKNLDSSHRRIELMKDYLREFTTKYRRRETYKLFSIAFNNEFIARGMYLFGILPTVFIKV